MKLTNENENYCASIVKVNATYPLEGLDNLVGISHFGFQALVPKDTKAGDIGVFFTPETQLSAEFCHHNNLFRHSELNADPEAKGYLEDNRRVKAIKLRGNVSSAIFLPLDSLAFLGVEGFKPGDTFTSVDEFEICRKFIRKIPKQGRGSRNPVKQEYNRVFPQHFQTAQYFRQTSEPKGRVTVTQKLHGTSARFAHQLVEREPKWWEKVLMKLGVSVDTKEYKHLAGTRRTVREPDRDTFYEDDVWNKHLAEIKDRIPRNWVIYGEIIGYAGAKEIQKNYSYRHGPGESTFYVYRIAIVNPDGISADLGWEAVKQWCNENGLLHVPQMYEEAADDFHTYADSFLEGERFDASQPQCVPLSFESPCDEGVCVRQEGLTPKVTKIKADLFYQHETKMIDKGEADMEEDQNVAA